MNLGKKLEHLVNIMATLRSENGCPWDKEQTHSSLRQYLIEETYEVVEMLDENNLEELPKELGDLLLQIIFHAQIAQENNAFTIEDVIDAVSEKLIRRHPHVFGDVTIESAEEQSIHWEKLKKDEGKKSVVDGVPKNMPALARAFRLQQKSAMVGFTWPAIDGVFEKLQEELRELEQARQNKSQQEIEDEFGDVLFVLTNIGYFMNINPEDALRGACEKFVRRFQHVEQHFAKNGKNLREASLEEMDEIWNQAKELGK